MQMMSVSGLWVPCEMGCDCGCLNTSVKPCWWVLLVLFLPLHGGGGLWTGRAGVSRGSAFAGPLCSSRPEDKSFQLSGFLVPQG